MQLFEMILIGVAIVNICLGLVIFLPDVKSKINRSYAFFVLSAAVWAIGLSLFQATDNLIIARIWLIIYYIAASLIAANFLYFAIVFPDELLVSFKNKVLIYIPSILFTLSFLYFNDFLAHSITIEEWGKNVTLGPIEYSGYGFYFILYVISAYGVLFRKLFKSSGVLRKQLNYIIWGTLAGFLLGMYYNLLLPWMGNYRLILIGPIFSIIMVASIAIAIAKHHLMNIKVITTELFTGLIVLVSLLDTLSSPTEVLYYKIPILIGTILFAVLLIRSVLKEVEARERNEALAKDLEHANTSLAKLLKMKSEFLNLVSHQLRTPLTAVVGFLEWWKTGEINQMPPEKQNEMMSNVIASADRLHNTVEDILTVLKVQSETQYKFEPFDLQLLIKESIDLVKPIYDKKNLLLKVEEAPKNMPASITGDKRFLKQVFINLIDNAAKYTEKGGTEVSFKVLPDPQGSYQNFITNLADAKPEIAPIGGVVLTSGANTEAKIAPSADIAVTPVSAGGEQTAVPNGTTAPVVSPERWVYVLIKDTGIGLDEEDKQRLFRQFSRGAEANKMNTTGTGLGLYLVKEIVEAHHGTIEVRSEGKGKGSAFVIGLKA